MWGLSAQDAVKYYTSSYMLMKKTTIWVNPNDLLLAGQKHETQILLTECARSLGLEHPIAVHVEEQHLETTVKDMINGTRQGVLKRSHSCVSHHVITPHTEDPLQALKNVVKHQQQAWTEAANTFAQPAWFFQPYLPLLLYLGELRTFILNGAIYYIIYTTPKEMGSPALDLQVTPCYIVRPLTAFR